MSKLYVDRLKRLQEEHDAVDASLKYVQTQLRFQNLSLPIESATAESLERAISDLPSAYFIRMFSIFEGMLREHMAQHHPAISMDEDAPAVRLIDRVSRLQRPPPSPQLRERVHEVRRYRNYLVDLLRNSPGLKIQGYGKAKCHPNKASLRDGKTAPESISS